MRKKKVCFLQKKQNCHRFRINLTSALFASVVFLQRKSVFKENSEQYWNIELIVRVHYFICIC